MYTDKDRVRVVIMTDTLRIEGDMHVLVGSRLTDMLNSKAKDFLAITDAVVTPALKDEVFYRTGYIAVNRESVRCLFPLNGR